MKTIYLLAIAGLVFWTGCKSRMINPVFVQRGSTNAVVYVQPNSTFVNPSNLAVIVATNFISITVTNLGVSKTNVTDTGMVHDVLNDGKAFIALLAFILSILALWLTYIRNEKWKTLETNLKTQEITLKIAEKRTEACSNATEYLTRIQKNLRAANVLNEKLAQKKPLDIDCEKSLGQVSEKSQVSTDLTSLVNLLNKEENTTLQTLINLNTNRDISLETMMHYTELLNLIKQAVRLLESEKYETKLKELETRIEALL